MEETGGAIGYVNLLYSSTLDKNKHLTLVFQNVGFKESNVKVQLRGLLL